MLGDPSNRDAIVRHSTLETTTARTPTSLAVKVDSPIAMRID